MKAGVVAVLLGFVCNAAWAQQAGTSMSEDADGTARFNHLLRWRTMSGAITQFRDLGVDGNRVSLRARVVEAQSGAGCGYLFIASPVMYQVVSGPQPLQGARMIVQVACIEIPMVEGNVADFKPGATHDIVISGSNPHPGMSHDSDIFLLSAVRTDDSEKETALSP